jgi:RNA polymerase sigma-70 factor (ECF subfamily)
LKIGVNGLSGAGVLAGVHHVAILASPVACAIETESLNDRFSALVSRRSRFVFQVAWAVLRNSHDAEDVVQETFLKLYRTGSWERMADERAFLARTAWRLAVDRTRGRKSEAISDERREGSANPEQCAIASDLSSIVQRLIDGLPEELRVPLALSAVEEMTSRSIADAMGIPEGTVRTRIMRARATLKKKLAAL